MFILKGKDKMEVEIKGFKGILVEIQSVVSVKSSFDKPRVDYYSVRLYNPENETTIILDKIYPSELEKMEIYKKRK